MNFYKRKNSIIMAFKKIKEINKNFIYRNLILSFIGALNPYIDLFFLNILVDKISKKSFNNMFIIFLIYAGLTSITVFIDNYFKKALDYDSKIIDDSMRTDIAKKAMNIDYTILRKKETQKLISGSTYAIEHTGGYKVYVKNFFDIISSLFKIGISLILISEIAGGGFHYKSINFSEGVNLFLFLLIIILYILTERIIRMKKRILSKDLYERKMNIERRFEYFQEKIFLNYENIKDIKIYEMKDFLSKKYNAMLDKAIEFFDENYYKNTLIKNSLSFLLSSLFILIFSLELIFKVKLGLISLGSLVKYIGGINIFLFEISNLISLISHMNLQSDYLSMCDKFMELDEAINNGAEIKGGYPVIELKNVYFKYDKEYVLKDINLKFAGDKTYAIIGENGAGKTSLILLILGLLKPDGGEILYNGVNINKLSYKSYMDLFSVVFGDFSIFNLKLAENISMNEDFDRDKVKGALRNSGYEKDNMDEFLEKNLLSYDDNYINPSGGEAQKLAFARALYKDAKIFIMDEATSSLDAYSEMKIYENLNKMTENKLRLFISHRMSASKFSDEIIVLKNGEIEACSSHDNLIKDKNGTYYKLYSKQKDLYK